MSSEGEKGSYGGLDLGWDTWASFTPRITLLWLLCILALTLLYIGLAEWHSASVWERSEFSSLRLSHALQHFILDFEKKISWKRPRDLQWCQVFPHSIVPELNWIPASKVGWICRWIDCWSAEEISMKQKRCRCCVYGWRTHARTHIWCMCVALCGDGCAEHAKRAIDYWSRPLTTPGGSVSLSQCGAETKPSSYPLFTPFSLPISTSDVRSTASEKYRVSRLAISADACSYISDPALYRRSLGGATICHFMLKAHRVINSCQWWLLTCACLHFRQIWFRSDFLSDVELFGLIGNCIRTCFYSFTSNQNWLIDRLIDLLTEWLSN